MDAASTALPCVASMFGAALELIDAKKALPDVDASILAAVRSCCLPWQSHQSLMRLFTPLLPSPSGCRVAPIAVY